jgi:hypothetical protein
LGYLINNVGVRPNPNKTGAVREFPRPITVADVRTFLRITSYFRRFIQDYAKLAKPLCNLLKGGTGQARDKTSVVNQWSEQHEDSFVKLKRELTSETLLVFPDLAKPFACDASAYAIGVVLTQLDGNRAERPVEYASRVLNDREARYSTTERKALTMPSRISQVWEC